MQKINKKFIEKLKNKDSDAFNIIYQTYHKNLYNYIRKYVMNDFDSDDVEQEIYMRMLDNICLYDYKKGSFSLWLFKVAKNYIKNYLMARQRGKIIYEDDKVHHYVNNYPIEDPALDKFLKEVKAKISKDEYDIFMLRVFSKMKYTECVEYLGLTIDQCKKRYLKAKKRINKIIYEKKEFSDIIVKKV